VMGQVNAQRHYLASSAATGPSASW
jgi:hypothetical protein